MAKIFIDNKEYEVDGKKNLLDAILSLKMDLPYFCWHPALGSVGACRQCAVTQFKDENDTKGKIMMACMLPIQEGMRVSIENPAAKKFRKTVIEWLMTNHPHDCPVCDEGGECHLQDMTVMSGHNYRRHRFKKRTYRNQYLGPFINHEMNRCIQCYRCVRFYRDYAHDRDLNAFAAHNHVYFGRAEDGVLESEFSGNLVEVCPTGVFTDKTLKKHYTRKWDMTSAPSVCHNCSLGCNTIASERYGELRRVQSRYNHKVNGYFICDRGRFGYEFVNDKTRILKASHNSGNGNKEASYNTVLDELKELLSGGTIKAVGSPVSSLEDNFALRTLAGPENFYAGVSASDKLLTDKITSIMKNSPVKIPSMKETEEADAVLILGEDLHNSAPMLALSVLQTVKNKPSEMADNLNIPLWQDAALRELIQDEKTPLFSVWPDKTKMDEHSEEVLHTSPEFSAEFGFLVASFLDKDSDKKPADDSEKAAKKIADTLRNADYPLIISGTSLKNEKIVEAAANIAFSLGANNKNTMLSYVAPEANSVGLSLLDPATLSSISEDNKDTLVILENDLYDRDEEKTIDNLLSSFENIVYIGSLTNRTSEKANFVFPAATFAEASGTIVNNEGRAQRYYSVLNPKEDVKSGWRIIKDISMALGKNELAEMEILDEITGAMSLDFPIFNKLKDVAPPPGYRVAGQKIPREPYRYSGRTAMNANKSVHEPKPPEDPDSPLSMTMEGYRGIPPADTVPFFWSPGWNSEQSINKYQIEVGGPLHGGSPGVKLIPEGEGKGEVFESLKEEKTESAGGYKLIPLPRTFGSDKFSMYTPEVQDRAGGPYFTLPESLASELNIKTENEVTISVNGKNITLPVMLSGSLPEGCIGYPYGFPGLPFIAFPAYCEINGAKE